MVVRSFSFFFCLICAYQSLLFASDAVIQTNVPRVYASVATTYQRELDQEERALIQELLSILGVTQQEWDRTKNRLYKEYLASDNAEKKKASVLKNGRIKKIASQLITKWAPKGKTVKICENDWGSLSTYGSAIFISPQELKNYGDMAIQAGILHELAHMRNEDTFIMYCLNVLYDERRYWVNEMQWEKTVKRWHHFTEKRADIFSGLAGDTYARANIDFFEQQVQFSGDFDYDTHPSDVKRSAYMKALYASMQKASNTYAITAA